MLKLIGIICLTLAVSANAYVVKRQSEPCPDDCENTPLEISFIVDGSASIWPKNFTLGLWFMQNFVDKFNIGPDQVRVSMVTFGDRVYENDAFHFGQHTDKDSLNSAINNVTYRSGTSTETGAAISWFLDNQKPHMRDGVRSVVIVLTDGNSQQPDVTKKQAERAHGMGLETFAIGVGHKVSQQELHNIASDGEHVFVVNDYEALDDILVRLAFETCGVKPNPVCQFSPVDISFVIDSSQSIGADNFTLQLEFIKQFTEVFEINPSAVRVSAIMFGNTVYDDKVIDFDVYNTKKETLDALLALPWMHGSSTQTGDGINYMTEHFQPNFRPHAAHIGIVITDGRSQKWKKTEAAAKKARSSGITILAVGVGKLGKNIDEEELLRIAGDKSHVLNADDFAQLDTIRQKLIDLTCIGIEADLKKNAPHTL